MTILRFSLVSVILVVLAWAGISKIVLEDLDKYYRTYKKVNTLYYRKLQDLQSRISIMPSFLWEATRLILAIEKEEKSKNHLQ